MASAFGGGEVGEMDDVMSKLNDPEFADTLRMFEDSLSSYFASTGADNFSMAMGEDGKMSLGFDFNSLDAFDKIKERAGEIGNRGGSGMQEASGMMSGMGGGDISLKGKWLTLDFGGGNGLDELMGGMGDLGGDNDMSEQDANDMMAMMEGFMGETMIFKYTYTFDKTIKKVKTDIPYKLDGNSLVVEYSLSDALEWSKEEKDLKVRVKLK